MYGNIIVASNAPDIPEIIKDGYNWMLFNAWDAQDLAKKLIPIINNKKTYEYLVENGYQEVEKYSIDRIVKRILEVLFIA